MKVIVAGSSKTGTKSMVVALNELGMKVHDGMEHYCYHRDDWLRICNKGGTTEDFRRMYEGVDAVTDLPTWFFWEELLQAYPESKVVLTVRDNEEVWCRSTVKQLSTFYTPKMVVMRLLSPTFRDFLNFCLIVGQPAYKVPPRYSLFGVMTLNEMLLKKMYRMLNVYAKATVPKGKLLVYNVKEGWEPLCKFLDVEVPDKPFPHKNLKGQIIDEYMATNPAFIRMQREMMVSGGILLLAGVYGCYRVLKSTSVSNWFGLEQGSSLLNGLTSLWK